MSKLREVIRYICVSYPHQHELSNARLTKMVYLSDWEFTRKYGRQITGVEWYFNNYGPYVDDILREAHQDKCVEVITTTTMYGTPKLLIRGVEGVNNKIFLEKNEISCIDSVIDSTKNLYWSDFIRYVYDTFPIKSNDRYSQLDLVSSAQAEMGAGSV